MLGEIPYMIVWGFFSAMGWMGANWTVEKYFPDKEKQQQEQRANENRSDSTSRRAGQSADSGNNSGSESPRNADMPGGKN